jgi:GTP-binding protein HflX
LEAAHVPILVALNKIDQLEEPDQAAESLAQYPNSLAISAATGQGLEALLARIEGIFQAHQQAMDLLIPYSRGDLISLLHEQAIINHETHQADGACLDVYVPEHLIYLMQPYQLN